MSSNRGRSQFGRGGYSNNRRGRSSSHFTPHSPASVSDGNATDNPSLQMDNVSYTRRQTTSWQKATNSTKDGISSDMGNLNLNHNLLHNSPPSVPNHSTQSAFNSKPHKDFIQSDPTAKSPHFKNSAIDTVPVKDDSSSLPADHVMPSTEKTELSQTSKEKPFDICIEEIWTGPVRLNPPLHQMNREKRKEIKRAIEGVKPNVLKPGMILLKNYISCSDQVKIVKKCRELGLGKGGFYQPGYRTGAELHLKMMCLGKNWDPETSQYSELRPFDLARPPLIPNDFKSLAKSSIQDSHAYLLNHSDERNIDKFLPPMSPDLCIVNFYSRSGRLGLHQDKDESQDSIGKRLPVVSFSIGDSAEFLYSEQRDVESADKVILESGDVLIFGGESRLIFHGVETIIDGTAPKALLEESKLRPGRLNLTFRQY